METGPDTLPTWRSRATSAGWTVALIVGLGTLGAVAAATVAALVWVIVSAAVT